MADFRKNNKVNTTLLVVVLAAIGLGAVVVLYPVYLKKEKLKASNYKLHEQLKIKEFERAELTRKVHGLHTDPFMVVKVKLFFFMMKKKSRMKSKYE